MPAPLRLLAATALAGIGWSTAVVAQPAVPAGCVGTPSQTWLMVTVQGVRSSRGLIAVAPYPDDPSRFLAKHRSLGTVRVPAQAGATTLCVFVPAPGVYALATYHDENGDRKLDRSGLGLPKEGFGFSNNPSTFFGIPSFRAVRLAVPHAGVGTRINLRYP